MREVVSSSSVSTSSLTHGNLLIGIGEDGVGVGGIIVGCPTMPLNNKNYHMRYIYTNYSKEKLFGDLLN